MSESKTKISSFWSRVRSIIQKIRSSLFKLSVYFSKESRVSVITGSDTTHFISSIQLLNSIKQFEPSLKVLYFNLGLNKEELEQLRCLFPLVEVIDFPFHDYPDYFDIRVDAGQYAWKPTAIRMAQALTEDDLLWMDAGNLLVKPLGLIKKILHRDGVFIMQTSNTVEQFTHVDTLNFFAAQALGARLQLSAAIVGFSRRNTHAERALIRWDELAKEEEVIAPQGSSRLNHRQDQALLTLILFSISELDIRIIRFLKWKLDNKALGVLTHQDLES